LALAARHVAALDAELGRIRGIVPSVEGISIGADVSDEASVQAMVRRTLDQFGQIDVLVNAAGVTGPIETPAHKVSAEDWDQVLAINAKGTFLCCKAVLPHLIERKGGKIVNIAGTSGLR